MPFLQDLDTSICKSFESILSGDMFVTYLDRQYTTPKKINNIVYEKDTAIDARETDRKSVV